MGDFIGYDFLNACEAGNIIEITKCINDGVDIDTICRNDNKDETGLMLASKNGRVKAVELLIKSGAKINKRNHTGWTALILACKASGNKTKQKKQEQIVKLLVEAGADINLKNQYKQTALLFASEHGSEKIVNILINNNADVNVKSSTFGWTALLLSCFKNHKNIVEILLNNGANINDKNKDGKTVFDIAQTEEIIDIFKKHDFEKQVMKVDDYTFAI